ncbi:MAG TPA: hypothetical protein VG992_02535, partial [Candidatus Saccharimonadales bacterium]|nr:hypothetical protein [Candidatus Saccharimonadales bacterium]
TAFMIAYDEYDGYGYRRRDPHMRWDVFLFSLVIWAVVYGAVNAAIVYPVSAHYRPNPNGNTIQEAQQFGLQSGQTYPLVLGARLGGSDTNVSAHAGLFSANVAVSSKPDSALSVSFEHAGKSYLLELPTNEITFIQSTTKKPSVTLNLASHTVYSGLIVTTNYSHCHFEIHNFATTCSRRVLSRTYALSSTAQLRGLAAVVSRSFSSAVITLTPTMYQRVLNS